MVGTNNATMNGVTFVAACALALGGIACSANTTDTGSNAKGNAPYNPGGGASGASGAGGSSAGSGGSGNAGANSSGGNAGNGAAGNGAAGTVGGSGSGGGGGSGGSGAGTDAGAGGGNTAGDGGRIVSGTGQIPSSNFLPTAKETCPMLATGMVTVLGQSVQLWAGTPSADKHGPLVYYWHGTGSHSSEATYGLGQAQIDAITAMGGLVASQEATNMQGTNTGNNVWYTGDFDVADEVVACAIDQLHIDVSHIHTMGVSAGGLQTVWMAYGRSGYIASAAPISGGLTGYNGFYLTPVNMPQDPSNTPAGLAIHGAVGKDVVTIDFAQASAAWEADIAKKMGFSVDCNTGGGHAGGPPQICPAIWQFFQDHPFKVSPEPYQGALPSVFPSYCQIGPIAAAAADGGM